MRKGAQTGTGGASAVKARDEDEPEDEGLLAKMSGGATAAFNAIKNGGLSPEQAEKKAKQQAAREKRRKETCPQSKESSPAKDG